MNELALFAGAGGGILGGKLLGWTTVCGVEIEPYPAGILCARQNDGILAPFPIWDDVRTFSGKPWRGIIDVVSGGFPCQDISPARTNNHVNGKQLGLDGTKSGMWYEQLRIICEVGSEWVLVENSSHLTKRGLGIVLKGLSEAGYDAEWDVFSSEEFGADHERKRTIIVAHSNSPQFKRGGVPCGIYPKNTNISCASRRESEPGLERTANGMAAQMDRLKAIGNGQDAEMVAMAFVILSEKLLTHNVK